jgi:hypothetical protein
MSFAETGGILNGKEENTEKNAEGEPCTANTIQYRNE